MNSLSRIITTFFIFLMFLSFSAVVLAAPPASQADCPVGTTLKVARALRPGEFGPAGVNTCEPTTMPSTGTEAGAGVGKGFKTKTDCNQGQNNNASNCKIIGYIQDFTNALSAIVGIVAVIMIAYWGLQYTVARDNPQATATARLRLLQTVGALVAYLFMYAFLQYLVPGGIF